MWKITFRYSDGGVITVRGKGKDIPLHLAQKYVPGLLQVRV